MRVPGKRLSWLSGAVVGPGRPGLRTPSRVALLATVSFVGALLEAFFLVIITGVAMALVAGDVPLVPFSGGPSASAPPVWRLGLVVLIVRLGLNIARRSDLRATDGLCHQRARRGRSPTRLEARGGPADRTGGPGPAGLADNLRPAGEPDHGDLDAGHHGAAQPHRLHGDGVGGRRGVHRRGSGRPCAGRAPCSPPCGAASAGARSCPPTQG